MALLRRQYDTICERLRNYRLDPLLKNYFNEIINSKRRMAKIATVGQLIDVLEKRDVLNFENPEYLHYITSFYDRSLWDAVMKPNRPININFNNPIAYGGVIPNEYSRVLPIPVRDPIKRIHELIADNIGTKWKDLARELDIPEGWIDRLSAAYPMHLKNSVYEVLEFHYNTNYPGNMWRNRLQDALRHARRSDLSVEVGDILSRAGIS